MKVSKIFVMGWLLVSVVSLNTAVFKIINKTAGGPSNLAGSRIKVRPIWNGGNASFVELEPNGETGGYDTGFNNLTAIIYEEVLPQTADQKSKAMFCTRRYKANFDINGWAVGGKIYIQSDADVSFSFDTIAGSGTVKAQPSAE
jgi:hypothetical protein